MADPLAWLDRHIIEQANFYGTSPEKLQAVMNGAAKYDEMILAGIVDEPDVRPIA